MSQPTCIVMVGLPATGKSTRVRDITTMNPDAFVYSTDQFIEEAAARFGITYNEAFEDNIKAATESMDSLLVSAIKNRMDVVWDQTNLAPGKRRKIINRMRQAGYRIECECILPPAAGAIDDQKEWKYRLASRPGKIIPEHVLTSMYNNFVKPELEEGFDAVFYWNMYGNQLDHDKD